MKKYNALYYLLFILLVMGAFASMAQNNYGLKIMGGVAFVFALVFLAEFITVLGKKGNKKIEALVETACLFLLAVIFGCRVFYIHFAYIEVVFGVAGTLLLLFYLRKMILRFRQLQLKNGLLATLILIFHLSIILFLVSLVMVPFSQKISQLTGLAAFILLIVFLLAGLFRKKFLIDGENFSVFSMVTHFNDHSLIITSLFLLFSLYTGLNRVGLLPGIYTDEFPRAYYELLNNAATKKEEPVNGKYKYEEYKKRYDEFLKNNSSK